MEDSNAEIILKVLFLLAIIAIPQAVGVGIHLWARRRHYAWQILAVVTPPAIFYTSAVLYWDAQAKAIVKAGHRVCGAFGAASALSTIFGTLLHLVLAGIVLIIMYFIRKRQRASNATESQWV
jgi:hypothetical protein